MSAERYVGAADVTDWCATQHAILNYTLVVSVGLHAAPRRSYYALNFSTNKGPVSIVICILKCKNFNLISA